MANGNLQSLAARIAREEGIPPSLALALVQAESGFNPSAVSPAGAGGLTQLMPGTAQGLGVTNVFDPEQNLRGGFRYLKQQLNRFGSTALALSAYNSGPAGSEAAGRIENFPETQAYVQRVTELEQQYASQGFSGAGGPGIISGAIAQRSQYLPPLEPSSAYIGALSRLGPLSRRAAYQAGKFTDFSVEPPTVSSGETGGTQPIGTLANVAPGQIDERLTQLAQQFGLNITSGHRTPAQNAAVGGSANSFHMRGRAIDIAPGQGDIDGLINLAKRNPGMFEEFIYDPMGGFIDGGTWVNRVHGGHDDHIHLVLK